MLQFTVSLTTFKQLPEVENNIEAITAANVDSLSKKDNAAVTDGREASSSPENQTAETGYGNKFLHR